MSSEHERINAAGAAAQRAWLALAALETARTSEDVDRARHGAQHELETLLRILGFELPEPPGATPPKPLKPEAVELPFAEWPDALKSLEGLKQVVLPPDFGQEVPRTEWG